MISQSQLNFPREKTGSSARAAQASPTASSRPPVFQTKKSFRAGSAINRLSSTSTLSSPGDLPVTPREMAMESVSPSRRSPRLQEREIMSLDAANKKVLHPDGQKVKPPTPIFFYQVK
jgi:hypothetical protein